jgi:hypothetical protein
MMNSVHSKILAIYALVALLGSVACENIALIKRPTPDLDGDEIVGEITSIDSRQISLRPTPDVSSRASTQTIRYDDNTRVLSGGREYPVSSLEIGDIVALESGRRDREHSANLIRVQQSRRDRDLARSGSGVQRIEGTVERVDSRGEFELRERSGAKVIVLLPPDAPQSVVADVEQLRRGDRVLGEGRYVSRDRFELEKLF